MSEKNYNILRLKQLGIDTYKEAVIYMRSDSQVCLSEGFDVPTRIKVSLGDRSIVATLNTVSDSFLHHDEAGLSNHAWEQLESKEGDLITVSHTLPLQSMNYVRSKIFGNPLGQKEISHIIQDITKGYFADIEIAAFLAACGGGRLNLEEIVAMTQAMIEGGDRLVWPASQVVDKHCVGGLPGNRTSLIVVPIVASFGLTMPKTSSRAITSPAGTADTMEVMAPVDIDLPTMRKIVEKEQGCIVWGGAVTLSPADDILIGVERVLDIDSEGQLIASVLSKKIAAGSTHIVIDIPVGPTSKVRNNHMASILKAYFLEVSHALGVTVNVVYSDGRQPVGRGIGPALEARDVLEVLQGNPEAPMDLKSHALILAGHVLEFSPRVAKGEGRLLAEKILDSGDAWKKFLRICEAQGGFREPQVARHKRTITAPHKGKIGHIDNRKLARVAKLAGAPHENVAGVDLHTPLDVHVEKNQPLFTIHSNSTGQLSYALDYLKLNDDVIRVEG